MPSAQKKTKLISGSEPFELVPECPKELGAGNSLLTLGKFDWKMNQKEYYKAAVCLQLTSVTDLRQCDAVFQVLPPQKESEYDRSSGRSASTTGKRLQRILSLENNKRINLVWLWF